MSFKVKILNIDSVIKKIESLISEDILNNGLLEDIKDFSVLRIQAETRKGNDLVDGGKQADLSPGYIRIREKVANGDWDVTRYGRFIPDPDFMSPRRSNLTATGQMLDSLDGKITKSDGTIVVTPTGSRDPSLQYDNTFKTNVALAKDLASRGRKFLGLDKTGVIRIKKMVLDEIRRLKKKRGFK